MKNRTQVREYFKYLLSRRKDRPRVQLDIFLGLISSYFLALVYFVVYFQYDSSEVLFLPLYLVASFVMWIQFGVFAWVFFRKKTDISRLDYTLIKQHSFLIMGIGIGLSAIHTTYDRQMMTFVIAIISSAIVSSHRPITSVVLYGSSLLIYGLVMSYFHFDIVLISGLIRNSIYFSVIALFYSFISYYRIIKESKQYWNLASEAQKNKKLIDNLTTMNQEITRNNEISKIMMELTSKIIKFDTLDDFFDLVLQKAIEIIPNAQKGSVLVNHNGKIEYKAVYGYSLDQLSQINLSFDDIFQSKLEDLYSPIIVKNLVDFNTTYLRDETLNEMIKQNALEAKVVLTCAFALKGQFYGSINLDNIDDVNAFSEEDKMLIKHLATQIEVALINKSLLDDVLYISRHDSLTKMYTRTYFEEMLEKNYTEAKKNHSQFSLCIIDTDDLKKFNDQFGHMTGDRFLIYFSSILKKQLQQNEVYGRTGGDEFTIYFPNMDQSQVVNIIQQVYHELQSNPFVVEDVSFTPSFSYGIAEFPKDSNELASLISLADKRMYMNKQVNKKTQHKT